MGSNRRRRRRREQPRAAGTPPTGTPPPSGWRATIDSWGGFTVIGSLGAALVVVVVLVVVNLPGSSVSDTEWVPIERTLVDGRVEGDPNAPVRIVEFSDFQCPFCQRFTLETAPLVLEQFVETGRASLEYRHFSFLGPESFAAAEASECASEQNRFWDYHDIVFLRQGAENRGVFSTGNLKDFARELQEVYTDFDLDEFDSCVDSGRMRSTVEQMTDEAAALGVRSTPSFLINGQLVAGAQGIDAFGAAIEAAEAAAGAN